MTLPLFGELKTVLAARVPQQLSACALEKTRPASVLIPFYEHGGQPYLLFVKRREGHYPHAGQVAFPGGKREPHETSLECALRETDEEVGVKAQHVEVLGQLDQFDTVVSGYCVTPIVGVIPFPYQFCPQPREVERLIHVPLLNLFDERSFSEQIRQMHGQNIKSSSYAVGGDTIWGMTARIISSLLCIMRPLGLVNALARPADTLPVRYC